MSVETTIAENGEQQLTVYLLNKFSVGGRKYKFSSNSHELINENLNRLVFRGKYLSYRFCFSGYVPGLFKVRAETWLLGKIPINIHFSEIGDGDKNAFFSFVS
jgi:hypothetical protein